MRAAWEVGGMICGYLSMSILLGRAVLGLWHDRDRPGRKGWE